MIAKTLWERYLFREILKVFFLFLGCFFFLYALIDYSMHMQDFIVDKRIQISHIVIYYFFHFIKRADLLIPLALLISTLKVLFALNARGELIALQASGLPRKKILRPFFSIALTCVLFNLMSSECLLPSSLNFLDRFRQEHFKHYESRPHRREPIHVLHLKDRSKIIYQTVDSDKKLFHDVFWIRSVDEIWRMQSLSADPENPIGFYVDHLQRNSDSNFEKVESFDQYRFSKFRWQPDPTGKGYTPLENRALSELVRLLQKSKTTAYEYPQVLTHLLFKIAMPFLSLLVVTAGAPFCLRYSRNLPIFFTYAIALFAFIAFFALMDAAVILGENLVISPYLAILAPIILCWAAFSYNYQKSIKGL